MLSFAEDAVRAAIQKSDAPFLGLLGESLADDVRDAIKSAVQANPTVAGYTRYLARYPALFAVHLGWHVMRGVGQTGHFELYSHVGKATGVSSGLSMSQRQALWYGFRLAVLTLGLQPAARTSGPHYMADEYLRQAGVPLAFVDSLAQQMLKFARRVGLPDEDDPEAVSSWQMGLDSSLGLPFSITARKSLQLDTQGYYTRTFLRVHRDGGQIPSNANELEQAMARAFSQQGGSTAFRRTAMPYVLLNDGVLGVFVPAGDDRELVTVVDGKKHSHRVGAEDRFIPFDVPLPLAVQIGGGANRQPEDKPLWGDTLANRILVFSENGRLKGRAVLGQSDPLPLPPGHYRILSRFVPRGISVGEVCLEPRIFEFDVELLPGGSLELGNGPAALSLIGEEEPFARWEGTTATTKERVQFHYGDALLRIVIPRDWMATAGRRYAVRLLPGVIGNPVDVELEMNDCGAASVQISEVARAQGWKAGFARVQAEVRRPGESRVFVRISALYWHGLRNVTSALRFECDELPCNLARPLCQNVTTAEKSLKPVETLHRVMRLVFDLGDNRQQSLTWNRPGIFVDIETYDDSGKANRLSRPLGSSEAVSVISSKQIIVSSNASGTLRLGEWQQYVDFGRLQSKQLSAAFLADRISPQSSTLMFQADHAGVEHELLKLRQPHNVESIATRMLDGQLVVTLCLTEALEAVQVCARELTTGVTFEVTLTADATDWSPHAFGRARLMTNRRASGAYEASVYVAPDQLPTGAWLLDFEGSVRHTWGHLENLRQDRFAAGFLWSGVAGTFPSHEYLTFLRELSDEASLDALENTHTALLVCYSQSAWDSFRWLDGSWSSLVSRWRGRITEPLTRLADLAMVAPPADSSPSWFPPRSISANLVEIYSLEGSQYGRVNTKPHVISVALRAIHDVQQAYPSVFPTPLHTAVAAAFGNLGKISRGGYPERFSIDRYTAALAETDATTNRYLLEDESFLPGDGQLLSPLHFRFALRALEQAYGRSLAGNEIRRGQAVGMCRDIWRALPTIDGKYGGTQLIGQRAHINPWWLSPPDDGDDGEAQYRENIATVCHTLSWLAFCCRADSRRVGMLEEFASRLRTGHESPEASLSYLLQVGESIFLFYLLLWEVVMLSETVHG